MKKTFLHLMTFFALIAFSSTASAQVDFTPIFTQIKLEARADFDYYHNTENVTNTAADPYGFHGRYFNFVIGGPIGDKFSYFFRQRIVATPGDVSLFDNTDFLYLNYMPSKNWMIRVGKDALAVGGFEYDAPPINVLFSTHYWDNFYCFQPAVAAAYKTDDANQMFLLQVANSPYVHYGAGLGYAPGSEWKSGLLSFNAYYSGKFGHFKVLHSVNMFERPDHKFMNYIAIGHELEYKRWDIYLDLIHHANAINDWGNNYAVVSCANIYFDKGFNIFVKGAYEQNHSNDALPGFGIGNSIDLGYYDCFGEAGYSYLTYGLGAEYRPEACPDFRLHAFIANRTSKHLEEGAQPKYEAVENSLRFNIGITWDMDIHRMLKDRIAKSLSEKSALE
ncbi:MAG: hypothetical protein IJK84_11275 [Bacteroidales bacterium]|nr:hypothetical protein [Bacteroidales bacterium]